MGRIGPATAAAATIVLLLSGCGNSVYGPRRIVQTGYLDNGSVRTSVPIKYSCQQPQTQRAAAAPAPPSPPTNVDENGINLIYDFNRLACLSINSRPDATAAAAMMDSGFTLNRLRCNDFFAERAAHQTQARVWRGTIAPVSAIVTGIIGLANFTDSERVDAIQILGITQAATIAGFELYEQEFLFDSDNVNAVRRLVMRALDAHSMAALSAPITGFNHGVRHLMDNQMICTPANILELVRTSIAEGEVRALQGGPVRARLSSAGDQFEQLVRANTALSFGVSILTDDQLGTLWWLAQGGQSQEELAVIADRLGNSLNPPPLSGVVGNFSVSPAASPLFAKLVAGLKPSTVDSFTQTAANLRTAIANRGATPAVDAAKSIRFSMGTVGPGGSMDITAGPTP